MARKREVPHDKNESELIDTSSEVKRLTIDEQLEILADIIVDIYLNECNEKD